MGEMAEALLEGLMCQGCGELIGDPPDFEPLGYPGWCPACQPRETVDPLRSAQRRRERQARYQKRRKERRADPTIPRPWTCGDCDRAFASPGGLADHRRDKHGVQP